MVLQTILFLSNIRTSAKMLKVQIKHTLSFSTYTLLHKLHDRETFSLIVYNYLVRATFCTCLCT